MSSLSVSAQAAVAPTSAQASSTARAADGDYKTAGKGHMVKDADGDYKAAARVSAAPVTAAATSTSAVQGALTTLQKGG